MDIFVFVISKKLLIWYTWMRISENIFVLSFEATLVEYEMIDNCWDPHEMVNF